MKLTIQNDRVATLNFVLKDDDGDVIDASEAGDPLIYLHGHDNIVPGLEEALAGKSVGEESRVEVPPEKGYGVLQKIKPKRVPRSMFPDDATVEKGVRFVMQTPQGQSFPIWVVKVMGKQVHVTTQHPLAGVTLVFDVTIRDIRDATEQELAHGHPHGPGGHPHDEAESDGES